MPPGQPIQAPSLARMTGSSAVTRPPGEPRQLGAAVGVGDPVDGQPVGDDHEVGRAGQWTRLDPSRWRARGLTRGCGVSASSAA